MSAAERVYERGEIFAECIHCGEEIDDLPVEDWVAPNRVNESFHDKCPYCDKSFWVRESTGGKFIVTTFES